ncbi:MAG: DEAD/DEAH box helicase [Eubacteriales bacterium]|nr:DEAD/DEAH box helicase [Eubacteriales bacterium]
MINEQQIYDQFADFIQDYIYEKGWNHLNPMQLAAAECIFQGEKNVLLMAGTAQGKTEAAFFPAISVISQRREQNREGISILYISPLKALINDQFFRIEELLKRTDITLTKWHGDAPVSSKKRLLENANGILQMTIESLEAMFCLHPERIPILFSNLTFVIIDEIHYYLGNERGLQLITLLERIHKRTGCQPLRIGLSATIGEKETALSFLNQGSGREGRLIHLKRTDGKASLAITTTSIGKEELPNRYLLKIMKEAKDQRSLLFTNSRRMAELLIVGLKELAKEKNLPDYYYIHHGNIGKSIREETEEKMKKEDGPILTASTRTLELGIDIGDLDQVLFASDPPSISSMVQRLGRSGRKSGKAKMSFHLRYFPEKGEKRKLDLSLIRSMAMIEVYFREHHLENDTLPVLPYHFLVHVILSVLCEKGCLQLSVLAREVMEFSAFTRMSLDDLRDLLHALLERHLLLQYEDGAIGLDDKGEEIVNSMNFFALFQKGIVMGVYARESFIGSVDRAYRPGDRFYLAGQSWEVIEREIERKRLQVIPFEIEKNDEKEEIAVSYDGFEEWKTDEKTMRKIHEILAGKEEYLYLDEASKGVLQDLRKKVQQYQLLDEVTMESSGGALLIQPCLSTKTMQTIFHILKVHNYECELIYLRNLLYGIRIKHCNEKKWHDFCHFICKEKYMLDYSYVNVFVKTHHKYDEFLPANLKGKEILWDELDLLGARAYFQSFLE